jgi:hypothetical protein
VFRKKGLVCPPLYDVVRRFTSHECFVLIYVWQDTFAHGDVERANDFGEKPTNGHIEKAGLTGNGTNGVYHDEKVVPPNGTIGTNGVHHGEKVVPPNGVAANEMVAPPATTATATHHHHDYVGSDLVAPGVHATDHHGVVPGEDTETTNAGRWI